MKPSIYTIKGGKLEMTVTDFGARVLTLMVPDRNGVKGDVAVGYTTLEEYLECKGERFFGAAVGRLANRLGGAKFTLDGKEYAISVNDNGKNTLHGGFIGFDNQMWTVEAHDEHSITFSLLDKEGNDGWPGNLKVWMKYSLTEADEFKVEYEATTDAPTLVNLTHHTFFNLTGDASKSILGHELQIAADKYIPVGEGLIPTGEVVDVEGTPFDFRVAKAIGRDIAEENEQLNGGGGYDHNWCLDGEGVVRPVATLYEPESGRKMTVSTDQCGIQFYSGNFFDGSYEVKGKVLGHRCALALETQKWPDAIHHENFPETVLRPGEKYTHICIYKFTNK